MQNHHGLLVIDKPRGLTSRDVVNRVQTWFPRRTRVGHMGTLDPLATGVLVIGVGEGTRLTEFVQDMDKVYRAGILLGSVSDTDDADGLVSQTPDAAVPAEEAVRAELGRLVGEVWQVPPSFSAIKVTGRRAYDLARRGDKVELAGRKVRIYDNHLLSFRYPHLQVEVRCGKGTYIRSLARDLGQRLGCGGLIETLRRERIGPFSTNLAVPLERSQGDIEMLPLAMAAANLPALTPEPRHIQHLREGRPVPLEAIIGNANLDDGATVALFNEEKVLLGIASVVGRQLRPLRMLRWPQDRA